jgi:ribonuclease E
MGSGPDQPDREADHQEAGSRHAGGADSTGNADSAAAADPPRTRSRASKAPQAHQAASGAPQVPSQPPPVPPVPQQAPQVPPVRSQAPQVPQVPVTPPSSQPFQAPQAAFQPPLVIFQPPDISSSSAARRPAGPADDVSSAEADAPADGRPSGAGEQDDGPAGSGASKRRRRGGRGKGRSGDEAAEQGADGSDEPATSGKHAAEDAPAANGNAAADDEASAEDAADGSDTSARRRRRRRRSGHASDTDAPASDDPPNTVVHVRAPRGPSTDDGPDVKGVKGSTRLEAKRQRRREGRESGRRRPPIITESEFLARREAVERVMVVRQRGDRTQIAVLEDGILVEHYVDKASHQSYVGNVYLGRVQNVLPSMEAAFVDIGKGRNAVLYAGEVNFDASGLEGESKRIESALKSGQSILVQATKDPIGHKGARLTSQVSLPGRYLVYVPGASMTGISRKLPDTERTRLKQILKQVMPEDAGVIVRTAAEGATEEELSHDVARLAAQWEAIERKAKSATAPELLYSEPDLTIRVVRDIFNEDFTKLVIASDGEWDMVDEYVRYVAPNLAERLERWTDDRDVFAHYRIDEQIAKALERKVWLPSGGSLVIDTTEAMTVIDVNTGKFTGQGGNLEQTVTRNNLEAAEEIVRQLRVRDVGGIIVIDFIDMVLESNRELVLRRLLECLARDRTKHQVAEVTSLGLVQMTRKRVGSGLLEAFSVPCEHCNGRGVIVSLEPVEHAPSGDRQNSGGNGKGGASRGGAFRADGSKAGGSRGRGSSGPQPRDVAAASLATAPAQQADAALADASADGADTVGVGAADGATDGRADGAVAAADPAVQAADGEASGSRSSGGRRRRRSAGAKASAQAAASAQATLDEQSAADPAPSIPDATPDQATAGPDPAADAGDGHVAGGAQEAEVRGQDEPAAPHAEVPAAGGQPHDNGARPSDAPQDGVGQGDPGQRGEAGQGDGPGQDDGPGPGGGAGQGGAAQQPHAAAG